MNKCNDAKQKEPVFPGIEKAKFGINDKNIYHTENKSVGNKNTPESGIVFSEIGAEKMAELDR